MLLKINDVISLKQLQQLDGLDVDFAGIKFSPTGETEQEWDVEALKAADLDIKLVGIFNTSDTKLILQLVEDFGLSVVQLNGEISPYQCMQLAEEVEVIKTFYIDAKSERTIDFEVQEFDESCDYYLFEALYPEEGLACLEKIRSARIEKPFFMSDSIIQSEISLLDTFQHPDFYCIDFSNKNKNNPGIDNLPAILLLKNRFKIQNN